MERKQLYGPVNYRGFQENGPQPLLNKTLIIHGRKLEEINNNTKCVFDTAVIYICFIK